MKKTLLVMVVILSTASSCKKEEPKREAVYGRVMHARSNTPVDKALVRFMSYEPPIGWENGTYTEITTDTTGPDGIFEIPSNEDITDVQAWGLQSIYPDPSDPEYLIPFQASGRTVNLYLEAPGWLRVIGVDQGLNADMITAMSIQLQPGLYGNDATTLDPDDTWDNVPGQAILKVLTHKPITVKYRIHVSGEDYEWQQLPGQVIVSGLDTLTVEVPF